MPTAHLSNLDCGAVGLADFRFLAQPRWIAATAVLLLLVPAFLELSLWQFHRLDARRASNLGISSALSAPPVPIENALVSSTTPDSVALAKDREWRRVTLNGSWLAGSTVYARRHWRGNRVGLYVVDAFRLRGGSVVAVARGWIPPTALTEKVTANTKPPVNPVNLVGWLRAAENGTCPPDLPNQQISVINPSCLMNRGWTSALLPTIWVQADSAGSPSTALWALPSKAAADVFDIPSPELSEGPHLSYAWQWRLFAVLSVIGWVVLIRTERIRIREAIPEPLA